MTDVALVQVLAWPLVAAFAICAAIAGAVAFWWPLGARAQLERLSGLVEQLAGDVEKLKARVAQAEASGAFATTASLVQRLRREDGR